MDRYRVLAWTSPLSALARFTLGTPVVATTFRAVPRAAVGVRFELIDGFTSWALSTGLMKISRCHVTGDYPHLRVVLAHEIGPIVAFRWGTQAFLGVAPEGWPTFGSRPEESWADCVSRAFTGVNDPGTGPPSAAVRDRTRRQQSLPGGGSPVA